MNRGKALLLRNLIEKASISLDDETALNGVELFPVWRTDTVYSAGDRIQYNQTLYKCIQAHTSQSDWVPDKAPALWVVVSLEEWPEWVQPTGVHDSYSQGDKVSHNSIHWTSDVNANVWEPGVYGWTQFN